MKKKQFEEPEMEVVRFNALESVIATSGCSPEVSPWTPGSCSGDCDGDGICMGDD